jgi:hypothetical protein
MTLPLTKKCFQCCVEKPRSEYWCGKKGTSRLISRCKPCHIAKRREYVYGRNPVNKKVQGFAALDIEKRDGILEMLNVEPKPTRNAVAKKFGIPYTTLCRWMKSGTVV